MIRAAVAGLGWWGKHMVRRLKGSDKLEIVTAIETNPAMKAFATEHGLNFSSSLAETLKQPGIDAVILCTPHSFHTEQVLAVAAAGKHVFCEKPLALTRADAERSVAACKKAGVMLGIGHERRYEPGMKEIRRLVRSGELGTIMHIEANFSHDKLANVPKGDWRASPKDAPAAGMTAMGIHLTDSFVDLFGPMSEVYAATTSRVAYPDNGDVVSVHARFASGPTGYLNAILVTANYICTTVYGSKGWVEARNLTHPDTPGPIVVSEEYCDGRKNSREFAWTDTVRENVELFAAACKGRAEYPFTDQQKIANIAALEAICKSVASNQPIKILPV